MIGRSTYSIQVSEFPCVNVNLVLLWKLLTVCVLKRSAASFAHTSSASPWISVLETPERPALVILVS